MFTGLLPASITLATQTESLPLQQIHVRDPFVLPVPEQQTYYLFGTGWRGPGGPGFQVYRSTDLRTWQGPEIAFQAGPEFWADRDYWAPEVHLYQGRYYLFGSFKAEERCRGTQILVSDQPQGPYVPLSDRPATPANWECLDGTLFIDDADNPWMVFCHEWVQVENGEMCAMRLSPDLSHPVNEPVLLFRASEAPWVIDIGQERHGKVTDGPFLHRMRNGALVMLWSSFSESGYCLAVARSLSGHIKGPWEHAMDPIYEQNGGHGMIFRTFEGELRTILHQPNGGAPPVPTLLQVRESDEWLSMVDLI